MIRESVVKENVVTQSHSTQTPDWSNQGEPQRESQEWCQFINYITVRMLLFIASII